MLTPRDVADAVYLLCLPEANMINGHTLVVDGGFAISGFDASLIRSGIAGRSRSSPAAAAASAARSSRVLAADGADVTFFYRGNADAAARSWRPSPPAARSSGEQLTCATSPRALPASSASPSAPGASTSRQQRRHHPRTTARRRSDADVNDVLATNVGGVFNVCRAGRRRT